MIAYFAQKYNYALRAYPHNFVLQGHVRLHSEGRNTAQYTSVSLRKKPPLLKTQLTWHCYCHCLFGKASGIVLYTPEDPK